jgi:hypothetical protein
MSRRRQETASVRISGGVQDARGVWGRACEHSPVRNRRDPSRRPTLGVGGSYKPMAKGDRVGRESEGFVVLSKPVKAGGGKEPCFGRGGGTEVSARAWSQDLNTPMDTHGQSATTPTQPGQGGQVSSAATFPHGTRPARRSDVLPAMSKRLFTPEARMLLERTIGKPYAGNPHVRFERGPQETEPARHRA